MSRVSQALTYELRLDIARHLCDHPNWTMLAEYATLLQFRFGTPALMTCSVVVRDDGTAFWFNTRQNSRRRLGDISHPHFFDSASRKSIEYVYADVLPIWQAPLNSRIELSMHAIVRSVNRSCSESAARQWLCEVLDCVQSSLDEHRSDLPSRRRFHWRWICTTAQFLVQRRTKDDYAEVCRMDHQGAIGPLQQMDAAIEMYAAALNGRVDSVRLASCSTNHIWYRDYADLETIIMADGLL